LIIACPSCATGYLLPEHLVGPGGARVRCPSCQQLFAVDAKGRPKALAGDLPPEQPVRVEAPAAAPAAPGGRPGGEPLALAHEAIERLAAREGADFGRALTERRLFSSYGPALMAAYDELRGRVGAESAPAAFRQALRERWGVSLVTLAGPGE
jgi:predicted Zn finger-like uncharacterized protein